MITRIKDAAVLAFIFLLILLGLGFGAWVWFQGKQEKAVTQADIRNLAAYFEVQMQTYTAKNGTKVAQIPVVELSPETFNRLQDSTLQSLKQMGFTPRLVRQISRVEAKIDRQFRAVGRDTTIYLTVTNKETRRDSIVPVRVQIFESYHDKYNRFVSMRTGDTLLTQAKINVPVNLILELGKRKPRLYFWKRRPLKSASAFSPNQLVEITDVEVVEKINQR